MRCRDCGTSILDSLGQANGGFCKPCARDRLKGSPDSRPPDTVEEAQTLPESVPQPPAPPAFPPAPEGFRYIYNRTAGVYEPFFDGAPVIFAPHEVKLLPSAVADNLRSTALIPGTLRKVGAGTLQAERALALGPGWIITDSHKLDDNTWTFDYAPAEAEETFLVPTETQAGAEMFDRTSVPNYADRPSRENVPTTARLIRV